MQRRALIAVTVLAGLSGACGKDAPKHIAELAKTAEVVERNKATSWTAASVGDIFSLGDAVRTGAGASADLTLTRGGALHLDEETVVRFQRSPAKAYNLDVEAGSIELESTGVEIELETSLGTAVVERRGSVRLRRSDSGVQIDVLVGTVTLDRENGEQVSLGEGQSVTIDVGGIIMEDASDDRRADRGTPDAGVDDAPPTQGGEIDATVRGRGNKVLTASGWKPLAKGSSKLTAGTRVRVAKKSSIELQRGDERAVVEGAAEIVVGTSDGALLEATDGDVTLRATTAEVRLVVPGGVIVARAQPGGSVAEVDVGEESAVRARRGQIEVVRGDDKETLTTGESAQVTEAGVEVSGRAPARADFSISAGESATVHDPKAPTAVRIRFRNACRGEGIVEVTRRGRSFKKALMTSAGVGSANILVPAGPHRYRVLCVTDDGVEEAKRSSGSLAIKRDSGRRQLPRGAPHNVLDADGRRYTVLYQNRLPKLTFRWAKAPSGAKLSLHLDPAGGSARTVATTGAKHTFESGSIDEGSYTWWFEGGGKTSPKTKLAIDFDNAAATAYMKPPAKTPDGKTVVEGAVIAEWKVTVGGNVLDLDRHRRFSTTTAPHGDEAAIPVRISHPQHGVHYYLVHPGTR